MIEKERLISIYETMVKIRKFEECALKLFEANELRGSVHLYTGQEAIAATFCSLLTDEDFITSTHRGHGHCIAKGGNLDRTLAELMGKETGYCRGRAGSMHIADLVKGNLGANAIVGGGIPIATGSALTIVLKGSEQVAVSFFGDGAANQGIFHESINIAALWKLPVVYVCENNGFGISVPVEQSTAVEDISVRSAGYGIPGRTVDGNDVLAIYEVAEEAVTRARAGEGPTLVECKTYRWKGHWAGDPEVYRTRDEVETWKKKCPITRLGSFLIKRKLKTQAGLREIDDRIDVMITKAVEYARNSPDPDPAHVMDDVFFED